MQMRGLAIAGCVTPAAIGSTSGGAARGASGASSEGAVTALVAMALLSNQKRRSSPGPEMRLV